MVEYLSGGRVQGSSTLTSAPPQTSWKKLGTITINSGSATGDLDITAHDNLMVLGYMEHDNGSNSNGLWYQFNGVNSGNKYAVRYNADFQQGDPTPQNTRNDIWCYYAGTSLYKFNVGTIVDPDGAEKLYIGHTADTNAITGSTAVRTMEVVGKWKDTTSPNNRITNVKYGSWTNVSDTSECVVLGMDNDESDSGTNFWQELANVSDDSSGDDLATGTFAAKKWLYFEAYMKGSAAQPRMTLEFNGENSGSNYFARLSNNGGGAASESGESKLVISEADQENGSYTYGYIYNNASQQKLIIAHNTKLGGSSASSAPSRTEVFGSWSNTSDQITSMNLGTHANTYANASLRVWGGE
tara:strand:- start:348 stop:1412 length:1065 start_codon:yes stop_codon:yes gene_type:complete